MALPASLVHPPTVLLTSEKKLMYCIMATVWPACAMKTNSTVLISLVPFLIFFSYYFAVEIRVQGSLIRLYVQHSVLLTSAPAWALQLETWSPTAKGMVFVSKTGGGSENLAIVRKSSDSYVPLGDERQYSRQWWRTVTWNFLVCTHIYFKDIPIMNC